MPDDRFRLEAEALFQQYTAQERFRQDTIQASLGDGAGTLNVPGRMGWIYARLHGDPNRVIEVWCPTSIPLVENLVVDLQRVYTGGRSFYQIVGRSAVIQYAQDPFFSSGISGMVGSHAYQHQRRDRGTGGFDPLDIYTRALVTMRVRAQSTPNMTVYVDPGYYYINGFKSWPGGTSPTFTTPVVGEGARYDLLYLGDDDALHIRQGSPSGYEDVPSFPSVPLNSIPLAFIYLTPDTTTIAETQIVDGRVILTAATTPTGGNAPADAPYVVDADPQLLSGLSRAKAAVDVIVRQLEELEYTMQRHIVTGS